MDDEQPCCVLDMTQGSINDKRGGLEWIASVRTTLVVRETVSTK